MEPLLTTEEAAAMLCMAKGTLENLRIKGGGPQYLQRTPRGAVRYDRRDIEAWLQQQRRVSTSQVAGAV